MNYRRSVGAVLSTAALIAAMSPVAAFAKTSATDVADSTVTITGLSKGDTVTAYQVFDADIDSTNNLTYKAASNLPEAYDTLDELTGLKNEEQRKNAASAYAAAFTTSEKPAASPNNHEAATGTADDKGEATLTLDSGYWVAIVTSTSGQTKVFQPSTIDASPVVGSDGKYSTKPLEPQAIKSEKVTVDKGVGDEYKESTDVYTVGDHVPFRVTTNVPSYPRDSKDATFIINDKPTAGLSIDPGTITVTVGDTTVVKGGAVTAAGAKAFKAKTTQQAADGYTFDFERDFVLSNPGANVEINYTATLTSAAFSSATDVTGNTAQVTFNPNPYSSSTVTPNDKTTVQTYGYVFHKTDKSGNALEGATFTLYDAKGENVIKNENGDPITFTSKKADDGKAYVWFEGLGSGTYMAKETTVPAGKQKAQDFTFTVSEKSATADNPATTDVTENNYLVRTDNVVDPDQPLLPVTGEAGTLFITIGGVALIGAACIVVSRSRKRSE